jgi:hypothetical protein
MMKRCTTIICCLLLCAVVAGAEENAEQALRKSLLGKALLLRTPYEGGNLHFDAQGKLVNSSQIGTWTVDGIFIVDNVSLKGSKLELKGKRAIVALRMGAGKGLISLQTKRMIKLSVDAPAPNAQAGQFVPLLNLIFMGGDVRSYMQDYWTPTVDITQSCDQIRKQVPDGVVAHLDKTRPVYWCSPPNSVKPPRMLSQPQLDDYSLANGKLNEATSEIRILINEHGRPELIGVVQTTNDDLAVQMVLSASKGKFTPATKDGVPVATFITLETEVHVR